MIVYADNMVYVIEEQRKSLMDFINRNPAARLCISLNNLAEISKSDRKEERVARCRDLESAKPLFIKENYIIEQLEFQKIIGRTKEVAPFYDSHEEYAEAAGLGKGVSISVAVEAMAGDDFRLYEASREKEANDALTDIRQDQNKESNDTKDALLFGNLIRRRLMQIGAYKPELALSLALRVPAIMRSYPAVFAGNYVATARRTLRSGKAKPGDSHDYKHLLNGLPYCDFFVSSDKFTIKCHREVTARAAMYGCTFRLSRQIDYPSILLDT